MLKITPSIASGDPLAIRSELIRLQPLGRLHLDIEDGNFIDNITFGKKTVCAIAQAFSGALDVHLMTTEPERCLSWLAQAHVQAVCGHLEALPYPKRFLSQTRKLGMKAGLALNLKTHPEEVLPYADCLDYVLVMTSEPDGEEQAFFPQACSRTAAVSFQAQRSGATVESNLNTCSSYTPPVWMWPLWGGLSFLRKILRRQSKCMKGA